MTIRSNTGPKVFPGNNKFEGYSRIDGIGRNVENLLNTGAQFGRLPNWDAFQIGCQPI
jgi:hypothetical protein